MGRLDVLVFKMGFGLGSVVTARLIPNDGFCHDQNLPERGEAEYNKFSSGTFHWPVLK